MGLHRLSSKGARCVLLRSLERKACPVDSTFRVLKRTGVIRSRAVYRSRATHDELQGAAAATRRIALHVNRNVHGQRGCFLRNPHCNDCVFVTRCARVGFAKARTDSASRSR